ncbi:hypothetical protein EV580_1349 [Mycobacterium sp. BK086]|nr:hypothetical protein [Mycobacterium sp. BK086]TDO18165.1 hypothetical protein EV580_1349 [Mycobacterium sp. BK086]
MEDAALFASRDTTLPMINAIHLESTSTRIIAVATDRFVLGSAAAHYLEGASGAEFSVSLTLNQAKLVAAVAKACRASMLYATVVNRETQVTFEFATGESLTLPKQLEEHTFPEWRKIVEERAADIEGSVQVIGFDPKLIARFAKVKNARQMAIKLSSPNKGALVSIGDQFVGVVMPVRFSGDTNVSWTRDWLERPTPPAAETAKKAVPAKKAPAKAAPRARKKVS